MKLEIKKIIIISESVNSIYKKTCTTLGWQNMKNRL